jgi:hypothetical protein
LDDEFGFERIGQDAVAVRIVPDDVVTAPFSDDSVAVSKLAQLED